MREKISLGFLLFCIYGTIAKCLFCHPEGGLKPTEGSLLHQDSSPSPLAQGQNDAWLCILQQLLYCLALVFVVGFSGKAFAAQAINLEIIKIIESSGDPRAFNSETKCYGLYQISEICLKEFNQVHGKSYTTADLFDPLLNKKIAAWYFKRIGQMLKYYSIPITIESLIVSYNWGIGNMVKWHNGSEKFADLPGATRHYIKMYKKLSREEKFSEVPPPQLVYFK